MTPQEHLAKIESEINSNPALLDALHIERKAARTLPPPQTDIHPLLLEENLSPKNYTLVAQGDSWFDYPTSWDL